GEVRAPVFDIPGAGLGELLLVLAEPVVKAAPLAWRNIVAPLDDIDAEQFPSLDPFAALGHVDAGGDGKIHVGPHLGFDRLHEGRALHAALVHDPAQALQRIPRFSWHIGSLGWSAG